MLSTLNNAHDLGPVFPQQINPALNPADNDQFTQMSFFFTGSSSIKSYVRNAGLN